MRVGRHVALAVTLIAATGCFRQVVQTGRTPGPTVIDKPWTNAFLLGLVPPAPIDVSGPCPSGIATVVTQQSFKNGLVTLLTIGIYTPRHVTITCATGSAVRPGTVEVVAAGRTPADRGAAFARAMTRSARTGEPVLVRF